MTAKGFKIIDKAPRKGSRGTTVFFVHPKSREDAPFGFLVEVVQEPDSAVGRRPARAPARGPYVTRIRTRAREFPPVSTAEWEAQIAKDLKGADYEKRLVWKTDEGIAVRPYYRAEHVAPGASRWPTPPAPGRWCAPGCEPALEHRRDRPPRDRRDGRAGSRRGRWPRAPTASRPGSPVDRGRLRHRLEPLHGDRQAARAAPAVGGRGGGVRPAGVAPHPRAHRRREQDALRPVRQPAARDDRGAVGGSRRLRLAHHHALRLRRAPRRERPAHPPRGEPPRQGASTPAPARTTSRRSPTRWPPRRGRSSRRSRRRRMGGLSRRPARWTPRSRRPARPRRRRSPRAAASWSAPTTTRTCSSGNWTAAATPGRAGASPRRSRRSACGPSATRATTGQHAARAAARARRPEDAKGAVGVLPELLRLRRLRRRPSPTRSTPADLVVLCSADAEYLALAREIVPAGDRPGDRRGLPEGRRSTR